MKVKDKYQEDFIRFLKAKVGFNFLEMLNSCQMKGFKEELNRYLIIENVLWIFLILLPFLLKDSVIRESIQFKYFDYFRTIPFLILIGVIIILWNIKSKINIRMFIFKWFFPVCLWINLYLPKEENGVFIIIFIDILYCVLILYATYEILKPDNYNPKLNHGLISDDPIESDEENDSFGRKEYSRSIVSEIRKTVNKRAFNIAITGAWGSGKTSFLNLIKGDMQNYEKYKSQFIKVKYNPWDFKEDKIIGLDLLKTISHELANEKELQEKFKGLMVSLQGMNQSPWYKVIPNLLIGFSSEKSINEYREEIGKALQDQNKKLVIFLDDLDRLDGDEILEVFKTIRNSFDIANTFFILGFDIDYVVEQIKDKVKGERSLEYLEKIFQMRLFMPSNSDYNYYLEYKQLVKSHFNIEIKTTFDSTYQINSKRILFQLINSLKVFFNKEQTDDYDFKALVYIEYIKIKYPQFYENITTNFDKVLNSYNSIKASHFSVKGESLENSWDIFKRENSQTPVNSTCFKMFECFFEKLDKNEEYKVKREEFSKYFKYSLQREEFSFALLKSIIGEENKVLLYDNLTDKNRNSLYDKIDEILKNSSNKDWLLNLFIELLFKDRKYIWLYGKKYYLNKYSSYSSIEDIKLRIAELHLKDKIVFLTELEDIDEEGEEYLINVFSEYFTGTIDDYYWLVYHSLKDKDQAIKEKLKQNFIEITRDSISRNYIEIFKSAVSISSEGGSRNIINHTDPSYYYLVGLFSSQDWLSLIPEDKNDEFPYSDIKNWLENLDVNNCGEFDFTKVFGRGYFDRFSAFDESKLEEEELVHNFVFKKNQI
jgi:hypothetical protein